MWNAKVKKLAGKKEILKVGGIISKITGEILMMTTNFRTSLNTSNLSRFWFLSRWNAPNGWSVISEPIQFIGVIDYATGIVLSQRSQLPSNQLSHYLWGKRSGQTNRQTICSINFKRNGSVNIVATPSNSALVSLDQWQLRFLPSG